MNTLSTSFRHIKTLSPTFWVVIAASFMNQTGNMAFVFLALYLVKHLGFSLAVGSFSFVIFSISTFTASLLGGPYIDRIGAGPIMMLSILINGFILLIFPLLHQFGFIAIACSLWGLTYGMYRPASQTLVSNLSTPGMHKITFSVYRLALNLGMSIGPAIGGFLAEHSFAGIFIANSIANILASLILMIGLRKQNWLKKNNGSMQKPVINLRSIRIDHTLLLFLLGLLPISMVFFQHQSTLPIFLNHYLHLPLSFYGLLFTVNTLMIVFCELPLNMATLNWPYRASFLAGSLFITLGYFGFIWATHPWHIIGLTMLWTVGEMILFPSTASFIAEVAPEDKRGSYMSLYSGCFNLGMMLGPWLGSLVMQYYGPNYVWLVCGLWGMSAALFFFRTRQPAETLVITPS